MKKIIVLFLFSIMLVLAGCNFGKTNNDKVSNDSTVTKADAEDSTIYGLCGEATAMHTLQIVKDNGDTLNIFMDMDQETNVQGGLEVGDRMAVMATKNDEGELEASSVINITTLLGRWTSLDKNFEIQEGGVVKSNIKAESHPYTSWKIFNGKLLLNKDTFTINQLGTDSLYLENAKGIFVYKRLIKK